MSSSAHRSGYRGPAQPTAAAPVLPASGPFAMTLDGLEVTQTVQDMAHTVPLVAGKTTVVRVYLGTTSATPIAVRGVLRVKLNAAGSSWIQVPSIKPVAINPAENGQLRLKRETLGKSLNFQLPASVTGPGNWIVSLYQLQRMPGLPLAVPAYVMSHRPGFQLSHVWQVGVAAVALG